MSDSGDELTSTRDQQTAAQAAPLDRAFDQLRVPSLVLLQDHLEALDSQLHDLPPPLRAKVIAQVFDLVRPLLAASGAAAKNGCNRSEMRFDAVKRDIVERKAQRDLAIAGVAARHRLSARNLQRLFARAGTTFSAYLLEVRLEGVYRLLADERHRERSISELAFDAGFGDMSHFNHAFRRRYKASPTQVRRALRSG